MINLAQPSFIFVALPCEAKSFIQAWHLKKQATKQPFATYSNTETVVVITGIGKIAMAAAVGYTMAQFSSRTPPIMLNVGIAGHRSEVLGSCFLVDKITDAETNRRFYPQFAFNKSCQTLPLISLSEADGEYADDNLRDMEASAFYEIAIKFSSSELIHCLKIVSDNIESPLGNIREDIVTDMLATRVPEVEELLAVLISLKRSLPDDSPHELYVQLLDQFHFTVANAAKLKTLLTRWKALCDENALPINQANLGSAKELLAWLEGQLEQKQFVL